MISFPLKLQDQVVRIHYEIMPCKESFLRFVKNTPPEIVILDMMQALSNGRISKTGVDIFKALSKITDLNPSYISHTAYPEVYKEFDPTGSVPVYFPKPADGDRIMRHITKLLYELVPQSV